MWSPEKNESLADERGITFERIVVAIEPGGHLDILAHPNPANDPRQRIMVVAANGYAHLVPFVEEEDCFLPAPGAREAADYY